MFYEVSGEILHTVLKECQGEWLISYEYPSAPFYVTEELLQSYCTIQVPEAYIKNKKNKDIMTEAELNRYNMMKPLIETTDCIRDRSLRREIISRIAKDYNTTKKRITRLYYLYLSQGILMKSKITKKIPDTLLDQYKIFDWAIKKYYYSAKKISLVSTYDLMLLEKYMDLNGHLLEDIPTWYSFRHYFYKNHYHRSTRKEISRNGLTAYQRNHRPLLGTAMNWKKKVGYYQIDETIADVYLVSRFNRKIVVGRPYIYMAVDTVSQLISGIYIGFETGQNAVLMCLANAVMDKVKYCGQYGIEIKREQWPSVGLPGGIVTDQGTEFIYGVTEELCQTYGMEIESLPPYRPDEKSLVENSFAVLQSRYKPLIRGKGLIEKDAQERWATDYRSQAVLNLDEFIKIIIHSIIYVNSKRVLESYIPNQDMIFAGTPPIPCEIWNWYLANQYTELIPINEDDLYFMSLKRKKAVIDRKGIYHNGIWYKNNNISDLLEVTKQRNNAMVGYDVENIKHIYLIQNGNYIKFDLPYEYAHFNALNEMEYNLVKEELNNNKKELREAQIRARVESLQSIKEIVSKAEPIKKGRQDGRTIKKNQMEEKNKLS